MSPVTASRVDLVLGAVGLGLVGIAIWTVILAVRGSWKRARVLAAATFWLSAVVQLMAWFVVPFAVVSSVVGDGRGHRAMLWRQPRSRSAKVRLARGRDRRLAALARRSLVSAARFESDEPPPRSGARRHIVRRQARTASSSLLEAGDPRRALRLRSRRSRPVPTSPRRIVGAARAPRAEHRSRSGASSAIARRS